MNKRPISRYAHLDFLKILFYLPINFIVFYDSITKLQSNDYNINNVSLTIIPKGILIILIKQLQARPLNPQPLHQHHA